MATRNYRLKIVTGSNEFEAEGDKAFVLEMFKRFDPKSPSPIEVSAKTTNLSPTEKRSKESAPHNKGKGLSIREFIQQFDLKRHTDITLAFGYYLEKYSDIAAFTSADINNCYYEAKLEGSNTSQMIVQNIKRGFMMARKKDEKDKHQYTLTNSGEKFIEAMLPK